MVVLVATDGLTGGAIDMGQPVQVRVDQDPVDGRRAMLAGANGLPRAG